MRIRCIYNYLNYPRHRLPDFILMLLYSHPKSTYSLQCSCEVVIGSLLLTVHSTLPFTEVFDVLILCLRFAVTRYTSTPARSHHHRSLQYKHTDCHEHNATTSESKVTHTNTLTRARDNVVRVVDG